LLSLHHSFQQVVNTNHGENPPHKKGRKRSGRELLDLNHATPDERVPGIDGWVITVREPEAGLTLSRRLVLTAAADAESTQAKHVTVYCTSEELAGFRLACAEAARAELEIANPLAGLRHYRTAALAFPFLPGLPALRDQLLSSAGRLVEATLQTAEACLKERQSWPAARPALERVQALIDIEDTLHVAFGARHALLLSLAARLEKIAQHRLPPDEAHDLLRDLRDELAGDRDGLWHSPGWQSARDQLAQLDASSRQRTREALFELRRQFLADATRACNDASASQFVEQFVQAGHLPPADDEMAPLQLEAAEALLCRADDILRAHEAAEAAGDGMHDAITVLHEQTSRLEGWRRDLHALINALSVAHHHAALGLREPAHLDAARYALSMGGRQPATPLRQAPHMFAGHPSLLQCKAFVDKCAMRRAAQEKLFREITLCLQHDATTQGAQLPAQGDEIIHALRSRLQASPPVYPIEVALEKLRLMKRGEPADACGLQHALLYFDSDDHRREHASLPAIEAVVQPKVSQVHVLRDWLLRFQHAGVDFPGAVDWAEEKRLIEALRDSGPAGLAEAQAHCQRVKAGEADGTMNGLWPLARMCSALSQESARAHLRLMLGEGALPLCAVARATDEQRQALWRSFEKSLRECDALLKNIALRIERYPMAWDAFELAHRALMTTPAWRRRRIAYRAEWQDFHQAAEAFNTICPNYSAFRARLQDVQARFHLAPAFIAEASAHEGHKQQHA
jgi:hypothetical protein